MTIKFFKIRHGLSIGNSSADEKINLSGDTGNINASSITLETYPTTDEISEGAENVYYTAERDTAQFNTDLETKSTTDLAEGTNLYYTAARAQVSARDSISVTNIAIATASGGQAFTGNLSYNEATGELSYTGPNAAQLRTIFAVDSKSALFLSPTGQFSTNASAMPLQVRLGSNAGVAAGTGNASTVAIGTEAGRVRQANNTIIINAGTTALNTPTSNLTGGGLYIKPIRSADQVEAPQLLNATKLQYDSNSGEIFYAPDTDLADQRLRKSDDVTFASVTSGSVTLGDHTLVTGIAGTISAGTMAWHVEDGKPVYHNGTAWFFMDGTPA